MRFLKASLHKPDIPSVEGMRVGRKMGDSKLLRIQGLAGFTRCFYKNNRIRMTFTSL